MKRKILWGVGFVFSLFLLWRIYALIFSGESGRSGRPGRPSVAVEVADIRFGPIQEVREYTGSVYPRYQYILAPKVSGRIIDISKRIGDWVNPGEIIARIDDAEYQQAVREAEANLKIAQASLAEARSQFELASQEKERVESLQEKGIASPAELDAAVTNYTAQESRYQLAQAQVEQRNASLKSAQIRLSYTQLTATEPGYVGERFVDEGALLAPNSPVVSVIGIDSVIVRTTIIERDYGRIQKGQQVVVTVDAFPAQEFYGSVSRIAPLLQETSRVAQMEVEVANEKILLKPGMFARVNVRIAEKDSAQIIPTTALVNRSGESGVFVVNPDESIAHYVPVTTGIATADDVEIISPALQGLVITLGHHLLDEGSPVLLPKAEGDEKGAQAGPRQGGRP
ncbi:efflux RND transporter periplasmic adaptor subunit [candidate division KSB1 bacterium]|nr:efflux RND transporter periplasmic adaptor subunit [candidate division KSB1 bacterium]RQW03258.1 MAG: efflux RND transporter periplasmic adaptor subunit [candidate division KSB1 bacterium]